LAFGRPALAENGKNSLFIKMLPFLNMTEIFSLLSGNKRNKRLNDGIPSSKFGDQSCGPLLSAA
jgi:hypothetical protein